MDYSHIVIEEIDKIIPVENVAILNKDDLGYKTLELYGIAKDTKTGDKYKIKLVISGEKSWTINEPSEEEWVKIYGV